MPVLQKFDSFVEALAEKIHNLGADQIKVALTNTAPLRTNTVLADIAEVAYTFCSTRNATITSSAQVAGVYKLVLAALTLTATVGAIGPFRYVVLYNDTAVNKNLIGYLDYGVAFTIADTESLAIRFDPASGVLIIQ